jgi:hypothetical protein
MTDTKISDLTAATALATTDELFALADGVSKRITGDNFARSIVGGPAWTTVIKASDTSRSLQGTPTLDPELKFTPVSSVFYEFEMYLIYASPDGDGVPDFKGCVAEDATARGWYHRLGVNATNVATYLALWCSTTSTFAAGTGIAKRVEMLRGHYVGNGVEAGLRWAQNTNSANATILYAGSAFRYRRID